MYARPSHSVYGRALGHQIGLEGFWDDVYNVAKKVAGVAQHAPTIVSAVRGVAQGQSKVAIVPADRPSFVTPIPGQPIGIASGMPSWLLPVGIGAVALLVLTRRR